MAVEFKRDLEEYAAFRQNPWGEPGGNMLERTRESLMEARVAASMAVREDAAVVISALNPTDAALILVYAGGWLQVKKMPTTDAQESLKSGHFAVWEKLKGTPSERLPDTLGGFVGIVGSLFRPQPQLVRAYQGF